MLILLHNPRCSKSREALKIMEESGKKYILREYLSNPLDLDELQDLQKKLGLSVLDFTRTKEWEFTEQWLTQNSSDVQILKKMEIFPKLMERPILVSDTKAILGRPPENIKELL